MNIPVKVTLAALALTLALGILAHRYWPRNVLAELETRPAVVVCPNCGQSDTTWAQVSRVGGRDEGGYYVPCGKCQQTARVYSPGAVTVQQDNERRHP